VVQPSGLAAEAVVQPGQAAAEVVAAVPPVAAVVPAVAAVVPAVAELSVRAGAAAVSPPAAAARHYRVVPGCHEVPGLALPALWPDGARFPVARRL